MLDREQNEFDGLPWYQVRIGLQEYIRLSTLQLKAEFIRQFAPPAMEVVRAQLAQDRDNFRHWLHNQIAALPVDAPRDWSTFPLRVENWIRQMCAKNNREVCEHAVANPECYAGIRLSYAVLFIRYFINGQTWQDTDYIDYLHADDIAYAKIVVTERNLADNIRQATRRPEVTGPNHVFSMSWLQAPSIP
jgi:hypothetical protein